MSSTLPIGSHPYLRDPKGFFQQDGLQKLAERCADCFVSCASLLPQKEVLHPVEAILKEGEEIRARYLKNKIEKEFKNGYRAELKQISSFCVALGIEPSKVEAWKRETLQEGGVIDQWTLDQFPMGERLFQLFHSLSEEEFAQVRGNTPPFLCLRGEWFTALSFEIELRKEGQREPIELQDIRLSSEALQDIAIDLGEKHQLFEEAETVALRISDEEMRSYAFYKIAKSYVALPNCELNRAERFAGYISDERRSRIFIKIFGIYLARPDFDLDRAEYFIGQMSITCDKGYALIKLVNAYVVRSDFNLDRAEQILERHRYDSKAVYEVFRAYIAMPEWEFSRAEQLFQQMRFPESEEALSDLVHVCIACDQLEKASALVQKFAERFLGYPTDALRGEWLRILKAYLARPNFDLDQAEESLFFFQDSDDSFQGFDDPFRRPDDLSRSRVLLLIIEAYIARPHFNSARAKRLAQQIFNVETMNRALDEIDRASQAQPPPLTCWEKVRQVFSCCCFTWCPSECCRPEVTREGYRAI